MVGTIAPPRALWRVSAGWDTAHDGCVRGGVLVRRLGWYGETAASRMLLPNRLRRNTHACLDFVSYDPRSGQSPPKVSREGTSAPELCSAASILPVMRFPVGELPGAPQRLCMGTFAPSLCSMPHAWGRYTRTIWSVWGPAVPFHA
jgi:hypothetical protein